MRPGYLSRPAALLSAVLLCSFLTTGCVSGNRNLSFGLALAGLPDSVAVFKEHEEISGLPVDLINFFLQWPEDPGADNFPGPTLKAISEFGALPVLTWEPMYYSAGREHMISAREITSGKYDPYIHGFALKVRRLNSPVIIRLAHEMNLARYHWGGSAAEYGPESPKRYIRMFRHVADIFRKHGADNALFAFCPNHQSLPDPDSDPEAEWNRAARYYPGHEYVDVLGMDGYNWGSTRTAKEHGWKSSWLSFKEIFRDIYQELKDINSAKPLYVFETSSVSQGGDKNRWIRDALDAAGEWGLEGLIWFQVDKEENWKISGFKDSDYYEQVRDMIQDRR